MRIEPRARHFLHFRHRLSQRQGGPILAVRGQRVQTIHGSENSRADRNLFSAESLGISRAIPALVVRADNRRHGIGKRDALQNLRAHQGMHLHLFELFRREFSGLVDDLFRDGEFPDIVQQGGRPQSFDLAFRQLQFFGHGYGISAHALQVSVRGLVLGLDGQRQGLDGAHVQRRDLFHVPLFDFHPVLFSLQPAQVQAVGAIHPVDQGQNQQGRFPSRRAVHDADQSNRGGADQVIGERPEVALRPDLAARFALSQSNYDGDRQRVGEEKDQGRHHQQDRFARSEAGGQPVITQVGERAGVGHHAGYVEQDFDGVESFACLPDALHQACGAANQQRLRQAQFQHAQQNEQEIHRHGAVDAGQLHFQSRGQDGYGQVAEESHQILRLPMRKGIGPARPRLTTRWRRRMPSSEAIILPPLVSCTT